ncbi:MAG: TonB-dependent receptor [Betaproteobacteria bacterium]
MKRTSDVSGAKLPRSKVPILAGMDEPGKRVSTTAADMRGISKMVIDAVEGVTGIVEDMHRNISGVAPVVGAEPIGRTRGITGLVYRSVRGITRAVGFGLDTALAQLTPLLAGAGSLPQREAALAAVNGVLGDYLAAAANPLAITMQLRRGGQPLMLEKASLATDPACRGTKLVVLVHGLCMNDLEWDRDGHDHGAALARDLGYTALYLNYNSGLHVASNGRELAALLEQLLDEWPEAVTELAIIGHSMGGLVARSACHHAAAAKHAWPRRLRKLIFLGTPHEGAPLERAGSRVDMLLGISPYTAPFAKLGQLRSTGVQDLRHGHLLDEGDGGGRRVKGRAHEPELLVPLPAKVQCYAIAATTQASPGIPGRRLPGDGLVPVQSALGLHADPARALGIPESRQSIAYDTNHFDLLSSRVVYEQIRRWLAGRTRGSASRVLVLVFCAIAAARPDPASAQDAAPGVTVLDPTVVTATRRYERSFDVPASVDRIGADVIQNAQPMVNLSESLVRVPGIVTFNRQNYAQDLQVSSRGFGARAAFGVRGVRLYQDEIPATMPDGQGQTGSFSLLSAESIEVLRGPFSTLYGNASGGVITVTTENGREPASVKFNAGAGSFGTWTAGAKANGRMGPVGYVIAGSHLDTDGYRDHSAASRDLLNAKLTIDAATGTRVTLIGSTQDQTATQDPLGLSRAQWDANPRQVDPVALLFDTRKTIHQQQGGVSVEQKFGAESSLRVTAYGGRRGVRQYLALSGVAATSSGGVTDLGREFGGIGARYVWDTRIGERPLAITVGADIDRQREHRLGFVNLNGALGDVRRDEDDLVTSTDTYLQAQWSPLDPLSFTMGIRFSDVRFSSDDRYITAQNPDDSGRRGFSHASPVLGAVWHLLADANVYASYGEGFETPTFAEMAYRPTGPGLNFTLNAAKSRATEIGFKTILARRQRINLAAFAIDTENEIVTDAATGGRTTFKNAGATRRRGFEAMWEGEWPLGFRSHLAYTYLRGTFTNAFQSGSPAVTVAAGSRLPGVPASSAYGEVSWTPGGLGGLQAALEWVYVDKVFVNDRNSDAAPGYAIGHARVGFEQQLGKITLSEFARINNLTDRRYVGSVIVGDTNGRFFEPAPGRNWFAGVTAAIRF